MAEGRLVAVATSHVKGEEETEKGLQTTAAPCVRTRALRAPTIAHTLRLTHAQSQGLSGRRQQSCGSSSLTPDKMAAAGRCCAWLALLCGLAVALAAEEPKGGAAPKARKKKDIRDYNDADMARLLEQWEKDDDIEEGDLPEHKRPSAPLDFSKIDPSKPESVLKMTKKGKTLMMFVTVSGDPTEKETEQITNLWQGSLFNANYDVQRFIVGSNRAIFMLRDGSYAWEIKDFLVNQERCADVTVEGQVYPGKGAPGNEKQKNKTKPEKSKQKTDTEKKPGSLKDSNRASKPKEDL